MSFPPLFPTGGELPLLSRALVALVVNAALGGVAWWKSWVSRSGYLGGVVLGSWILFFGGLGGYVVLLLFFLMGTGATRLGFHRKEREGLAQEEGGRRGARHALANCAIGGLLVSLFPIRSGPILAVAYVGSFATALADTLGSEVGQLFGRRTFDPLHLRSVPRGTEGAVSAEGTLAGLGGAAVLALLGALLGLYPLTVSWAVVVGAGAGSMAESVAGSALRGRKGLDNEVLNLTNTAIGALFAGFLAGFMA